MITRRFTDAKTLEHLAQMLDEYVFEQEGKKPAAEPMFEIESRMIPSNAVSVGILVWNRGEVVLTADNRNRDRMASGVVTRMEGHKVWFSPTCRMPEIPCAGTPTATRILYLGTNGGFTFDAPVGDGMSLSQPVGWALQAKGTNRYEIVVRIGVPSYV